MAKMMYIVLLALILVACDNGEMSNADPIQPTKQVQSAADTPRLEKQDGKVAVTIPANYVDVTHEKYDKTEVKLNIHTNGEVTYTMSEKQYEKLISKMKKQIDASMMELSKDERNDSVKSMKAEEDYQHLQIEIDAATYETSFDAFAVFNIIVECAYYQMFKGVENVKLDVQYIDAETKKIIKTLVYPDDYKVDNE